VIKEPVAWLAAAARAALAFKKKPKPGRPRARTVCSGCGSEWTAMHDGPMEPIEKCPNCPMSMDEFERLKEQVRNRNKGGGE